MQFTLECELEDDGRRLAEVSQLPGVLDGASANEAIAKAKCWPCASSPSGWNMVSPIR